METLASPCMLAGKGFTLDQSPRIGIIGYTNEVPTQAICPLSPTQISSLRSGISC